MKIKYIISFLLILFFSNTLLASRVYVLCYHTFLNKPEFITDFSIEELKEQIKMLKDANMKFVSLDDIYIGNIVGNNNVLITIDDGNRSVYTAYKEVFKPNKIPIAIALYNSSIGKCKYLLSWEQIDELYINGTEIMAHGYFSHELYDSLYETNRKVFRQEIYSPKNIFKERYNNSLIAFAYPCGTYGNCAINEIGNAGYKMAFTVKPGRVEIPYTNNSSIYLLPRYMIVRTKYKNQLNHIISDSKK